MVEELVKGVIDGSTVAQLRSILETMSEELKELYQRVISKRKPAYAMETYIMFQIALCARRLQSLLSLMATTDIGLLGTHQRMSDVSMQRRLGSRCGGLLELSRSAIRHDFVDNPEGESKRRVQFLH